jgi:hypothetical protein
MYVYVYQSRNFVKGRKYSTALQTAWRCDAVLMFPRCTAHRGYRQPVILTAVSSCFPVNSLIRTHYKNTQYHTKSRHCRKWEDNIKVGLTEMCCDVWSGISWFRIGTRGGLLWSRLWTFCLLKGQACLDQLIDPCLLKKAPHSWNSLPWLSRIYNGLKIPYKRRHHTLYSPWRSNNKVRNVPGMGESK